MKNRFSSLDIVCLVKELQSLVGMRVNQIYDIDNKTYLIKFQVPEKKAVLLFESGTRFHTTNFDWPKNDHPSGFCMKLRKHLRNKRLEYLKQLGKDRIVDLQFGSGDAAYHIFIELFDRGNVILTDNALTIVNLLRFHTEGDNRCVVRETYCLEHKKRFEQKDATMREVLLDAKQGDPFRKLLMPFVEYGPACLEHVMCGLGYEKGAKVKGLFDEAGADRFVQGFQCGLTDVERVCHEPAKGYIIKKKETRASGEEFLTNVEFHPYHFKQFSSEPFEEFDDFNTAVDEFFSQMETQKIDMKALQEEKSALRKVEKIRQDQLSRLKDLDKKQESDTLKAELITYNIDKVEEAITTIRSALAAQMSWNEISELVERAKDDPVGGSIAKLKFETNCITLKLDNPFSEDGGESSVLVDVDLDLSAYANVKKYYSDKKSASSKQQKTLQAQGIALKSAEKKVETILKDIQTAASITKSRLVFWFEKFFWFISSENYLVIGSRDKIQAELLIRRYMKPEDVFVHTDIPGASCFVIKNPSGSAVPPKTLNEAGSMAVCFSSAWNVHVITNAWWVGGSQIIRSNTVSNTDQFYSVNGQKNYLLPGQLAIGFGFVFYIDEASVERHSGERQVKFVESGTDDAALTNDENHSGEDSLTINKDLNVLSIDEDVASENADDIDSKSESDRDSESENEEIANKPDDEGSIGKPESSIGEDISDDPDEEGESNNHIEGEIEESNDCIKGVTQGLSELDENDEIQEGTTLNRAEDQDKTTKKEKKKNKTEKRVQQSKEKSKDTDTNVVKRGQKSRMKKIKEKYKDQDEEEKQLRMAILQSAGSKKETGRKSLKMAKEQQAIQKKMKRIPKPPPKVQQMKEESEEVEPPVDTDLSMLDRLTGVPQSEDKIIFALPVVAPYSTVVGYKYRVKMIPGTGKRGKSARSALNIFLASKETNDQEKAVMKSVNDQILCRDLPGKVKLSVGQAGARLKKKR